MVVLMRVAVTGVAGFTGRYLEPELRRRGHEPIPVASDLTDRAALNDEIALLKPEAVVHLAAYAFAGAPDYEQFYAVNQVGSFHLLDALARHTPGIRVLLASSAQVYGAQATGLLDETPPLVPSNHYALSKTAMEMGSRFWADRLRIVIVRPFNYSGVGQEVRYLVPKIVDHFRRQTPVIELGNIDVQRDFGDVRSVVEAYGALLDLTDDPINAPAIYNVCTSTLWTVRDLVARLEAMTGHGIEIRVNPQFVRNGDVPVLGGRNDRLRRAVPSWSPRSIDETLAWMIAA